MKWVLILSFLFLPQAFADGLSSGWSLSTNVDDAGTMSYGSGFSASTTGGFSTGGTQTASRTSTSFTKFTFTTYSGTSPWASNWNAGSSYYQVYGIQTSDFLITQPVQSTEVQPIFTVDTACPSTTQTVNWIFVQWSVAETTNLSNTYFLGTSTIAATTGAATMTAQYDVGGNQVFSGSYAMSLNPCSSGQATSTGGGDLAGTLFYAADGTGVYKTQPGNATFFFPQQSVTLSNLGGITYSGIQFDSSSGSTNNTSVVQVTSNASGNMFTVIPYSNVDTGALASTFTDTISITAANNPQNGMLLGSVTRTGTGAGGPTKIACLASVVGLKSQVICAGQSPANSNTPYSVSFVADNNCPANYVRVPYNSTVGTTADFCLAKYEMADASGVGTGPALSTTSTTTPIANPWVNIARGNGPGDGGAIAMCQAIGSGYDLITNAEWQTVARNIEAAQNGSGNLLNWSNGSNTGSNYLNMGNNSGSYYNGSTFSGLPPDLDSNPCSGMPGYPNCANNTSSDWAQKRTFELSNGNIVWDFAGNDYTWVKDTYTNQGNSGAYASSEPWTGGGISTLWGPAGNYTAMNSGNYGGLGYQGLGFSGGAVVRGGVWDVGSFSGVFAADLSGGPSLSYGLLGFRCVWHP